MNTKILASIAVFALLTGVVSTSIVHSAYAADYGTKDNAMTKKTETPKVETKMTPKVETKTNAMAQSPSDAVTVEMAKGSGSNTSCADKCYTPSNVQVKIGGTVTWKNVDSAAHYATSGKDATSDGNFDSGMVNAGKTFSHKFDKAGTFDYFCMVHPWMMGKVTVVDQKVTDKKTTMDKKVDDKKTSMDQKVTDKKTTMDKKVDDKKTSMDQKVTDKKTMDKKDAATSKTTDKTMAASDAVTVEMAKGSGSNTSCADKCYTPSNVQVKVGGTVTWKNVDSAAHYATSGKDATPDGNFDSGMVMAGKTFKHKFDKAGTFDYFCMVHPWMMGKVTVS